jgi:hypothetical protein
MDLDDLLSGLGPSGTPSKRVQVVARLVFGAVLAALSGVGAYHVATDEAGLPFRLAGVSMFVAVALFGVLGIGLGVRVRALGCLVLASFPVLFLTRILFGA